MDLSPGGLISGRYELLRELSGSAAPVWLARRVGTNSEVAIRAIPRWAFSTPERRARFLQELLIIREFRHPFIAEFFEIITDDRTDFLVREHVDSGNVLELVLTGGGLSEGAASRYFAQLLLVMQYLHDDHRELLHDLRPEDVLLDSSDCMRVSNFGLSRWVTGEIILTSAAPEVVQGQPHTRASDVWSAGVLLYTLVCGGLPFEGDTIDELSRSIVRAEPVYPPTMSAPLIDLLRKMLHRNPEQRITLERIHEHHWFALGQYRATLINYCHEYADAQIAIDRDVLGRMTQAQIDIHLLHEQILTGEWTPLTAVYRQLLREKLCDRMHEVIAFNPRKPRSSNPGYNFCLGLQPSPTGQPSKLHFTRKSGGGRYGKPMIPGPRLAAPPQDTPQKVPRTLQVAAPIQSAQRRMSKPNALSRPDLPPRLVKTLPGH